MSNVLCTVAPAGKGLVDIPTAVVSMDEPGYGLSEMDLQSPGSKGWHRYQVIAVVRNDRIETFMKDMGVSCLFAGVNQFRVPGGVINDLTGKCEIVHTVGELMDIADYLREGLCERPEYEAKTAGQFLEAYHAQRNQDALNNNKISTFGTKVAVQRS